MRVWDIPPDLLCRNHLLGEHNEIHSIWSIIVFEKKGYSKHPETVRWKGKLKALYNRHELVVAEMMRRGYNHNSPLDINIATGSSMQNVFVNTVQEQFQILREKKCSCKVSRKKR